MQPSFKGWKATVAAWNVLGNFITFLCHLCFSFLFFFGGGKQNKLLFLCAETPFGNLEQTFRYFKELILCHAVSVSSVHCLFSVWQHSESSVKSPSLSDQTRDSSNTKSKTMVKSNAPSFHIQLWEIKVLLIYSNCPVALKSVRHQNQNKCVKLSRCYHCAVSKILHKQNILENTNIRGGGFVLCWGRKHVIYPPSICVQFT